MAQAACAEQCFYVIGGARYDTIDGVTLHMEFLYDPFRFARGREKCKSLHFLAMKCAIAFFAVKTRGCCLLLLDTAGRHVVILIPK